MRCQQGCHSATAVLCIGSSVRVCCSRAAGAVLPLFALRALRLLSHKDNRLPGLTTALVHDNVVWRGHARLEKHSVRRVARWPAGGRPRGQHCAPAVDQDPGHVQDGGAQLVIDGRRTVIFLYCITLGACPLSLTRRMSDTFFWGLRAVFWGPSTRILGPAIATYSGKVWGPSTCSGACPMYIRGTRSVFYCGRA